jgi:dCTP deaminase
MTILCDKSIAELANNHKMIEPFVSKQVRADDKGDKIISYGNSSYGYDARVSNEFKIFTNIDSAIVDPKNFSE